MKSLRIRTASLIVSLSLIAGLTLPLRADALVPPFLPFGGITTISIPCTCTFTFWTWFTPLYLSSVPMAGPLAYVPYGTVLFGNFIPPIVPVTPHLGAYIPGVQACWMYVGIACIPLPVIGMMGFVGSGLPGGI